MINIYDYLDYRKFLKAYYQDKKVWNKAYSYQKMAWDAGFRSKSFFSEVISGKKNISSTSVFSVGKALELQGDAFSYFEALVTFNQSKTMGEKEHWFHLLNSFHKRAKAQKMAGEQFKIYSQWYHNSIRELATLVDFEEDFQLLGRLLVPAISEGKARASIKLLLKQGLLIKTEHGYKQSNPSITTEDEVLSAAVGSFHIQNMQLATQAIDHCPGAERDISCLVVGLSSAGFSRIKTEIQDFRKKLVSIIQNDHPAERVYHINFQLFPTSEKKHD